MLDIIMDVHPIIQWAAVWCIAGISAGMWSIRINREKITPCPSTTSTYDHKAARATMAKQDVEEHLAIAATQYKQAIAGKLIGCGGTGCSRYLYLVDMYRCYFCGAYFCPKCARAHFGDRASE